LQDRTGHLLGPPHVPCPSIFTALGQHFRNARHVAVHVESPDGIGLNVEDHRLLTGGPEWVRLVGLLTVAAQAHVALPACRRIFFLRDRPLRHRIRYSGPLNPSRDMNPSPQAVKWRT
jgi:hypothetical protein